MKKPARQVLQVMPSVVAVLPVQGVHWAAVLTAAATVLLAQARHSVTSLSLLPTVLLNR